MVERYDWEYARTIIEDEFGEQLRRGEHITIWESESTRIFGRSIEHAMEGKCDLGITRPTNVTPTIPRHLGLFGFSSRVGSRNGIKYVEIWLPRIP